MQMKIYKYKFNNSNAYSRWRKYGASTYAKEYFKMKDSSNPAYINAAGTIDAPNDTKGSIISVFRQK